MLIIKHLN